ncbi:probable prefoldin subunit 5 isoform X2 [Mangifera indica]|uniref:probable prefoldin subunit 5 isoform X2 n=1 Tax=Mangifera indica TaxID=29780 RepID=UPI001CFB3B9C|nr:probable prefoldin subunit 5 isoform X2 [Mangifera indica]
MTFPFVPKEVKCWCLLLHRFMFLENSMMLIKSLLILALVIEKTMAEGKDYCERKINLLKSNFDQLIEVASKKKNIADDATVVLQSKIKQLAPASS